MKSTIPRTRNSKLKTSRERPLRVLWLWHAAVIAEYQKPLPELARCGEVELTLLVPRRWPERAGQMVAAEGPVSPDYRLVKARTLFTGFYYVYFFPSLLYQLLRYRPDIIYCYEEAHTLISSLVLWLRGLFLPGTSVILYAAQNIKKQYPLPFRLFEKYCFARADVILACGIHVARTLRSKGYGGDLRVVPLPTDTAAFSPDSNARDETRRKLGLSPDDLLVGYAGKLVEEKGLRTLWQAFCELARCNPSANLVLIGGGPLKAEIMQQADADGLASRLHIPGVLHNSELPAYLNALDIFVLPSETRANWREQFGRSLV
ncbi:MAG TPA: glycosyltransferase, partial [Chloroflexia bacterium]|nr:glycosyltransferase [Chloroflexia bacterium]